MRKLLFLFIMFLLPIAASADDSGTCGQNVTWTYESATQTLTISGNGAIWNYNSNDNAPWFGYRSVIKTILIKNGVTGIGNYAFRDCSVTFVTIPNSVINIGDHAFRNCYELTEIIIPNGVTSIGNSAFYACSSLLSINIPNSVTSIKGYAFYGCKSLTSVNIPNNVTSIGSNAFNICSNLASITIGTGLSSIGENAFYRCSSLASIQVDGANTTYDSRDNCNAIIKTMDNTLVAGCKNSVIPNSVTSIGDYAFSGCTFLTSIEIPNSVTDIGNNAFLDCDNLVSVKTRNPNPFNIDATSFPTRGNITLYVPNGSKNAYLAAQYWKNFKEIVEYAYYITFADATVKSLCVANWDSNGDGKLDLDEAAAVTSIGTVFKNKSITTFNELQFFTGLKSISEGAFAKSKIKEISLPENVESLEKDAFLSCKSLVSLHFPAKIASIGQNALYDCTAMTSITVDENNSTYYSVEGVLFTKDKKQLLQFPCAKTSVYEVPVGTRIIGRDAFYNSKVKSVSLPSTLRELAYDAFGYSKNLEELDMPEGLNTIGDFIFDGCSALKVIRIPSTVISIGESMCRSCEAITDVYCAIKEPAAINDNNFTSTVYANATLHVPASARKKYPSVDGWKNFNTLKIIDKGDIYYKEDKTDIIPGKTAAFTFYHDAAENTKFRGFQVEFALPQGFKRAPGAKLGEVLAAHNPNLELKVTERNNYGWYGQPTNVYVGVQIDVEDFPTGEGIELFTFYVEADENVAAGEYSFTTTHLELADLSTGQSYHCTPKTQTLNVIIPKPYLAISEDGKMATFYYDDRKDERSGMVFDLDGYEGLGTDTAVVVTKAVFDPSFADARPTSTFKWFYGMNNLETIEGMEYLNTSEVTTMRAMFSECSSLASIDLSHFETSKVTSMRNMFNDCSSLTTLDVSLFNTSNVTNMYRMFNGCSKITSLDVSGFNTSNVTDMYRMFYGCGGLTSLDVSGFNTSNVILMYSMFSDCGGLTSLDVSGFNTSNVTEMSYMFNGCSKLTSLDLGNFDTSKVTAMKYMFHGCSNLTSLDLGNFDTSRVSTMEYMFYGCSKLVSLDLGNFNTSKVTTMDRMFYNCSSLTDIDVSSFNTSKVKSMRSMFNSCRSLSSLDISNFNSSNTTEMRYMFSNCESLTSLDLSNFDTSNATNTSNMLDNCHNLESLVISGTMGNLNDKACNGVGTKETPCLISAPEGFDFGDVNIYGTFQWKAGWFNFGIYSDCTLATKAVTLAPNENANMTLSLDNGDEKVSAFQFDLTLPEGVSLAENGSGFACTLADRCGGMRVRVVKNQEHRYSLMAFFLDYNKFIEGTSGPIVTLTLKAEEGLSEGDLEGVLDNIVLTNLNYDVLKVAPVTFPITISEHPMGDVNHDGDVNVADVMMTVGVILGQTVAGFHFENADMNGDGSLNITDVMGIVDIVLYKIPNSAPALFTSDGIAAVSTTNGVDIRLDNASRYTALEMTVELPKGATLTRASLCKSTGHSVETRNLGGGLHRVVVYSLSGEPLSEGDALLHFDIVGGGDVKISDVMLVNSFYEGLAPQEATGIVPVGVEDNNSPAYHIDGSRAIGTQRGVVIQNGKKHAVKR